MQQFEEPFWAKEASVFSRYLIGQEPDEHSVALYIEAQKKLKISLKHREASQIKFVLLFPFTLPMIEGPMAILRPDYAIRKKLYTMFCILESSPKYHQYFLPQERKGSFLFTFLLTGVRAVFNTIAGLFIVPWIY
ncbi:MAG TPA: hypothetical protein VNZ45_00710 [Bacteroidia bacterium]|jgi:hypothetical protein|nr:hypothetical protein [Bacteroidia bacterium]